MNIIIAAAVLLAVWAPASQAQVSCPTRCRSCLNNVAECSRRSLNAPPRFYPRGTKTINLEGNHIRVIAERTFGNLDTVEILKINSNKIIALRNDSFSSLPNLMVLDLTDNQISHPNRRAFHNMDKLRTLSLNKNRIDSIEGIFQYTPNLYQLNIANNKITVIGQNDLSAMTRVHNLDFRDNLISSIHSQAFKSLVNLRYLLLNNNPLVVTPRFEFSSNALQLVDFSNCQLRDVPGSFPASVTDLRLGYNKIMQVNSTEFTNVTSMQLLTMNNNELHFLADGALSHLTRLREVWLRHNYLVYIPRGIPNNVRKVYIDSNNIQQIEAGIFSNTSYLDYLTVESNQINRIQPNTFRGLRFLNTLNFQGNHIHTLEQNTFVDLGSLSTLRLSNNPLVRIEVGAFQNLGNLSQLFLSHIVEENFQLEGNFLSEMLRLQTLHLSNSPGLVVDIMDFVNNAANVIPPLENMRQLDLSYNTLQWISPRIREVFPNLVSLSLDGNPLRCSRNLKWLRDWMVSSEVSFYNSYEVVCETPLQLRDRTVRSIGDSEWAEDGVSGEAGGAVAGNGGGYAGQALRDSEASAVYEAGTQPIREQADDNQGKDRKSMGEKESRNGKGKGKKGKKNDKENRKSKENKKINKNKTKKDKKKKKGKQSKVQDVTTEQTTL